MGAAGLEHAKQHFAKEVTSTSLLRAYAAHTSLRFDPMLAKQHSLLGLFLQRWFGGREQLRHAAVKARDKTFDLDLKNRHRGPRP